MHIFIIENGVIANVIEAMNLDQASSVLPNAELHEADADSEAGPGWVWENGNAIPPVPSEPEPERVLGPVDFPLSDRQLRLGLIVAGVLPSTVEATIKAIPDPFQREAAWTWYDRSTVIHWNHPQTQTLMELAGFSTEQATNMWMAAKDLVDT